MVTWYVKDSTGSVKEFDATQLRSAAMLGEVVSSSFVAKFKDGPWSPITAIKGLTFLTDEFHSVKTSTSIQADPIEATSVKQKPDRNERTIGDTIFSVLAGMLYVAAILGFVGWGLYSLSFSTFAKFSLGNRFEANNAVGATANALEKIAVELQVIRFGVSAIAQVVVVWAVFVAVRACVRKMDAID